MILATLGTTLITIALVAVSVMLIGLVLLQKNRGSGLSGAFGGVGGHSAFGTKTGDVMTWITVGLTAAFLLLAIVGTFVFEPDALAGNATNNATLIETQTPTGDLPADTGTTGTTGAPIPGTGGAPTQTTP